MDKDKNKNKNKNNILSQEEIDKLINEIDSDSSNKEEAFGNLFSSLSSLTTTPFPKINKVERFPTDDDSNILRKEYVCDNEAKEKCVTVPSRFSFISHEAFLNNEAVEEVIIEEGVRGIGIDAFRGCTNLKKVTLPSTLTRINRSAFEDCKSLTEITLPDSVTWLEEGVFFKSGLKEIKLPKNITRINDGLFCGCLSLSKVTLPPFLETIGKSAFTDCVSLEEIKFPPLLEELSAFSFSGCTALKEVHIPQSVHNIDILAFTGCTSLESIKLDCSLSYLESNIFEACNNVKTLEINGNIEILQSLSALKNLETVILNSSTIKIANGCFNNLHKLSVVIMNPLLLKEENQYTLENEVGENHVCLGYGAFSGCTSLKMINQTFIDSPFFIFDSSLNSYLGEEENVVIPDNIKVIRGMSFKNNEHIKTVTIPPSVEVIEQQAFMGCKNLTKVIGGENVTRCEKDVFRDCPKVEGDLIERDENFLIFNHIATSLFYKIDVIFPKLKNVNIKTPDTIRSFAPSLFYFSDLESIEINEGVKEIKEGVFSSCSSLKKVILPESLETLSSDAFMGSIALEEVVAGDKLELDEDDFFNEIQDVKITRRKDYKVISKGEVDKNKITEDDINDLLGYLDYIDKDSTFGESTLLDNNDYRLRTFREQKKCQKDYMMIQALNNTSPFMSDKNSYVAVCEDNYTDEKIKNLKKEDELYYRYDTIIPFVKEDKVVAYGEPLVCNNTTNYFRVTNMVEEAPFKSNTFICYGTTNIEKLCEGDYIKVETVTDKNLYPLIFNKEVVAFGSLEDFKDEKKIKFTVKVILEKKISFLK